MTRDFFQDFLASDPCCIGDDAEEEEEEEELFDPFLHEKIEEI